MADETPLVRPLSLSIYFPACVCMSVRFGVCLLLYFSVLMFLKDVCVSLTPFYFISRVYVYKQYLYRSIYAVWLILLTQNNEQKISIYYIKRSHKKAKKEHKCDVVFSCNIYHINMYSGHA